MAIETSKRKLFSELLKIGIPNGSFTVSIINENNQEIFLVKTFNLSAYESRLPLTIDGYEIRYESRY